MKIGAVNDSKTIRQKEVDGIVRELCVSYSDIRRTFFLRMSAINSALDEQKVTEVIRYMAKVYGLSSGFMKRVGYSASIPAPAALQMEFLGMNPKPVRGTILFRETRISLCNMPRYRLLHIIAHELAHARMYCDMHELAKSEFTTDVLALLVTGNASEFSENMHNATSYYVEQHGYIRHELHEDVFRCLAKYEPVIYL